MRTGLCVLHASPGLLERRLLLAAHREVVAARARSTSGRVRGCGCVCCPQRAQSHGNAQSRHAPVVVQAGRVARAPCAPDARRVAAAGGGRLQPRAAMLTVRHPCGRTAQAARRRGATALREYARRGRQERVDNRRMALGVGRCWRRIILDCLFRVALGAPHYAETLGHLLNNTAAVARRDIHSLRPTS